MHIELQGSVRLADLRRCGVEPQVEQLEEVAGRWRVQVICGASPDLEDILGMWASSSVP